MTMAAKGHSHMFGQPQGNMGTERAWNAVIGAEIVSKVMTIARRRTW